MRIGIAHAHHPTRQVLARALASRLQAEVETFSCIEDALLSPVTMDAFVVYNNFGHHMDGVTGVAYIRAQWPGAFIIGVSYKPYFQKLFLAAGADAFLLRAGNEIAELVGLIRDRQAVRFTPGIR